MKRLFALRDASGKWVKERRKALFFETKAEAKSVRGEPDKNGNYAIHVTIGPDHWKFKS